MAKILIIGAGLTGLSLAFSLEKKGFFDYEIFEKDDSPGGLLKSEIKQNFTFDRTGHFLHISNPEFKNFIEEVLGLENCNQIDRSSFIYSFNKFIPYPFQNHIKELPYNIAKSCFLEFIEKPQINNPKNFYQWVLKYFGKGFGEHFFFPYNSKLLNQDPKKITPSWTGRFVPETSINNLFDNLYFGETKTNVGYNSSFFYPKTGGIFSLIQGILNKLKTKVQTCETLIQIDSKNKIASFSSGKQKSYNYLVTTAPLPELLSMIKPKDSFLDKAQFKLKCNSVINFNLGFAGKINTTKHWIYFPEKEFPFYRLGFWHNFGQAMAPSDHYSFYGEISLPTDKYKKNIEKNLLIERSIQQILELFGGNPKTEVMRCVLTLKYAYVLYDSWREKNLPKIHEILQNLQIHSIGRFGEWKYSSMQEAFIDGQNTANILLNKLKY